MIASLALLAILQAPDDLAAFLASLEKDKSTLQQKLEKINAWSTGKPEETLARIAWNKGLTEATIRIDALFVEGLKKRIGKQVTFGRTSGVLKEVKADRVVLGVTGGSIDLEFAAIGYDVRLEDIKKENLLPARSADEAIFRFAATKSVSAMATALALPAGDDRERALAAIAGWALQDTDKAMAGSTLKAAENLAATWGKQAELLAAGGGALRKFIDTTLAPKLVEEADAVLEKDRKEARKLLDLASALCKEDDIRAKVSERRWAVMDKGEWMAISLDAVSEEGGELKGAALAYQDTFEEKEKVSGLTIKSVGVGWDEISGVKGRVKPGKGDVFDMRFYFGKGRKECQAVSVQPKEGMGYRMHYSEGKEPKIGAGSSRKVPKKSDYEFVAQWEGKKWKFSVSGTEIDSFDMAEDPVELCFIAGDGSAELLSLQVRKR